MSDELTYDLMLEVKGVLRSIPARVRLASELQVGETLNLRDRQWIVSKVERIDREGLDRRVVAREVEGDEIAA